MVIEGYKNVNTSHNREENMTQIAWNIIEQVLVTSDVGNFGHL